MLTLDILAENADVHSDKFACSARIIIDIENLSAACNDYGLMSIGGSTLTGIGFDVGVTSGGATISVKPIMSSPSLTANIYIKRIAVSAH